MVSDPYGSGPFSALSVDLGSSSIKVLRGDLDDSGVLRLTTPRTLAHQPVQHGSYLEWDVEKIVLDVVAEESRSAHGERLAVSLDSWGDGLVFLDRSGRQVGPVRCYRDPGLTRAADVMRRRALPELVAERTGCTIGIDSTLGQLVAVLDEGPSWLAEVDRVVPLVDHLGDLLAGTAGAEAEVGLSPASTSGFVDPRTGCVDRALLDLLEIPPSWIPEPRAELRVAGPIGAGRLASGTEGLVVKVAGHDTATALVADPARVPGRCFVSLGSWAVVGVVVGHERRTAAPFSTLSPVMHEATAEGDLRVNRNITGLRLVQQLELEHLGRPATAAERRSLFPGPGAWEQAPVVDVSDLDVRRPVAEQIQSWGRQTGRPTGTVEQQLREVVRGIAWAIAVTVDDFGAAGLVTASAPVWICGGGVRVRALPVWLSELTGLSIEQGPVAASAVGGVLGTASVVRPGWPGAAVPVERWRKHGVQQF